MTNVKKLLAEDISIANYLAIEVLEKIGIADPTELQINHAEVHLEKLLTPYLIKKSH